MSEPWIVVIDDEPLNLEIIAEYLEEPGYRLTLFPSADQAWPALDAARDMPPDLVILDRMMPGTDGIGFLRKLKTDRDFYSVPVILQTAAAAPEQVQEGVAAGAYYYLAKPYSASNLLAVVRSALDDGMAQSRRAPLAVLDAPGVGDIREFVFSTLEEGRMLATQLASWCPQPELAVLGLTELFINAVEHGNLGITYQEKVRLRLTDEWENEILRRQSLPQYADRRVEVLVACYADRLVFTIKDAGEGFDWSRYLEIDPARAFDPSGRGIAMARQISFDQLEYAGTGNIAVATIGVAGMDREPT